MSSVLLYDCRVQRLSCLVFVMSRVCCVLGLSCLGFVMSRVCCIQGLSCLVFVMSRVCYVQGLSCLGSVMSMVCYIQGLLCLPMVRLQFVMSRSCEFVMAPNMTYFQNVSFKVLELPFYEDIKNQNDMMSIYQLCIDFDAYLRELILRTVH